MMGFRVVLRGMALTAGELVLHVGAQLLGQAYDEPLPLDGKAVRVLAQREGGLLFDLRQLGNDFFWFHPAHSSSDRAQHTKNFPNAQPDPGGNAS
jgi:hypothetical protein